MRWQIRCLRDNVKSILPFQDQLRLMKRRVCGYRPGSDHGAWTLTQGVEMVRSLREYIDLPNSTVLEVGTGWQPLIPLLFSMAGTKQVILTDLTRLLHPSSLAAALDSLRYNKKRITEGLPISSEAFDQFTRSNQGETLEQSLERFRLRYMAPCDCRSTGLPPNSVDAVISRAVMEHIPPDVILAIFHESARIIKPGGVACHVVDNSDHWQHRDGNISRVNFLKFSDSTFRLTYINKLNYQNRLRHSQYREMLEQAGFQIVRDEPTVDAPSVEVLKNFQVAPQFRRFTHEDLATIDSFFLARRPAAN